MICCLQDLRGLLCAGHTEKLPPVAARCWKSAQCSCLLCYNYSLHCLLFWHYSHIPDQAVTAEHILATLKHISCVFLDEKLLLEQTIAETEIMEKIYYCKVLIYQTEMPCCFITTLPRGKVTPIWHFIAESSGLSESE